MYLVTGQILLALINLFLINIHPSIFFSYLWGTTILFVAYELHIRYHLILRPTERHLVIASSFALSLLFTLWPKTYFILSLVEFLFGFFFLIARGYITDSFSGMFSFSKTFQKYF